MSELLRHRHTVEQYGVRVEIPTKARRISHGSTRSYHTRHARGRVLGRCWKSQYCVMSPAPMVSGWHASLIPDTDDGWRDGACENLVATERMSERSSAAPSSTVSARREAPVALARPVRIRCRSIRAAKVSMVPVKRHRGEPGTHTHGTVQSVNWFRPPPGNLCRARRRRGVGLQGDRFGVR